MKRLTHRLVIGLGLEAPDRHIEGRDGFVDQPVMTPFKVFTDYPLPQTLAPAPTQIGIALPQVEVENVARALHSGLFSSFRPPDWFLRSIC